MSSHEINIKSNEILHNKHEQMTSSLYGVVSALPYRFVFILTNLCNLTCGFCFQRRRKTSNPMKIQDWLSVVNQIPNGSRITITGGEPLIYDSFEKIIFAADEKDININIITNGVFAERLVDVLMQVGNVRSISISIDSIGNYTRNMKKNDYVKMIQNIKLLQSLRVDNNLQYSIDVKSVVLEECIGEYANLTKYLLDDIKVDSVSLQLLKGSKIQHSDLAYSYEEIFHKPTEFYKYKNLSKFKEEIKSIKEYISNSPLEKKVYMHPKFEDMTIMDFDEDNFTNRLNNNSTYGFKKCKYPWSSCNPPKN